MYKKTNLDLDVIAMRCKRKKPLFLERFQFVSVWVTIKNQKLNHQTLRLLTHL